MSFESVKLAGVFENSFIASLTNRIQDGCEYLLGFGHPNGLARDKLLGVIERENSQHGQITILFSGYSTIPCPPASLRRGIMLRTVVSSRMVCTATHPASLRFEIVGFLSAGRILRTAARQSLRTLSMSPTLPSALMAPSSSMRMSSILRRFHSSRQESTLAINWVFDSSTVSM